MNCGNPCLRAEQKMGDDKRAAKGVLHTETNLPAVDLRQQMMADLHQQPVQPRQSTIMSPREQMEQDLRKQNGQPDQQPQPAPAQAQFATIPVTAAPAVSAVPAPVAPPPAALTSNLQTGVIRHDAASQEMGNKAELAFINMMPRYGWKLEAANSRQERIEHWDFRMTREHETLGHQMFTVEVKAMKKLGRRDPNPQDRYMWVELKNIDGGDGWVYGKADYIAFEMRDSFIMVRRTKLLQLIERKLAEGNHAWVNSPEDAVYKLYGRRDRRDEVTLIPVEDLMTLSNAIFKKEQPAE